MKYINSIIMFLIFLFCLYLINNHYVNGKEKQIIKEVNSFEYKENSEQSLGLLIIPNLNIKEEIKDYNPQEITYIAMTSDYITKETGNIIINCGLNLQNLKLDDSIIIKSENFYYLFKVQKISKMEDYNQSYQLSKNKNLFLINEKNSIFIKAPLFAKNNPNNVT